MINQIFIGVGAVLLGSLVTLLISKRSKGSEESSHKEETKVQNSDVEKEAIVMAAKSRAKEVILEAKAQALKIKSEASDKANKTRSEVNELEKKVAVQKAEVDTRAKELDNKTKSLKQIKEVLEKKQDQIETLYKKQQEELEKIASLTKEEARKRFIESVERDLVEEKGKRIRQMEEDIKKESEKKAQEILIDAMHYGSTDIVVEHSTSKVKLPDPELKGRIIGKEGRNIRTFEKLTGVDLDMDSSEGEILVSSFDSVRREIAKVALETLITDGRIQPVRIEDIVAKTKKEIDHTIQKAGEDLCHKMGVYNLPKEVVNTLGKFKYRFSYGQNMLEHSMEVAKIGIYLARELGADAKIVKMGCLLHDIGKVITDEDGSHVDLGVEMLRKHKVDERVIECVGQHHDDNQTTIEAAITALADHISGARPGSRGEDYEAYIKRLKALEDAAMSFDGVDKVYAVSAGREVRVFVSPEKVDDYSTALLANDIAKKIELEQTYPGVVKVTVIRETRVTETAK